MMRKHRSKILVGVVCLIFIFVMTPLFSCKLATVLKGEPEFKEITFPCGGKEYQINIPGDMPDFTKFKDQRFTPMNQFIAIFNFYIPNNNNKDHYRFILSMVSGDCPGILILMSFMDDKERAWLYDENGNPYEVSIADAQTWGEAWFKEKSTMLWQDQEEEKQVKSI